MDHAHHPLTSLYSTIVLQDNHLQKCFIHFRYPNLKYITVHMWTMLLLSNMQSLQLLSLITPTQRNKECLTVRNYELCRQGGFWYPTSRTVFINFFKRFHCTKEQACSILPTKYIHTRNYKNNKSSKYQQTITNT